MALTFVIQPSVEPVRDVRRDSERPIAVAAFERFVRQDGVLRDFDNDADGAAADIFHRLVC